MSEFDRYTNDYQAMLNESLSLLGGFNDYYLLQKVNLLKKTTDQTSTQSILDAITLNPFGSLVTASWWLIQTSCFFILKKFFINKELFFLKRGALPNSRLFF